MELWHCGGLLLVTVWACSGAVINDGPDGASGRAGRDANEAGSEALEPAGGTASTGGGPAAGTSAGGESEAGVGGASGAPGHTDGGAAGNGDSGAAGSGPGGVGNCDFGASGSLDDSCSGNIGDPNGVPGRACESYGTSATLAQLVGSWTYSVFDVSETLEFSADGAASFWSFEAGISNPLDTVSSEANGTALVTETAIEFKISERVYTHSNKPPRHEAVSETLHYWYRYDQASDTLTLAECGSPMGTFTRH